MLPEHGRFSLASTSPSTAWTTRFSSPLLLNLALLTLRYPGSHPTWRIAHGTSHHLTWNGSLSKPCPFDTGVPQGSVLGHLLFSLFTRSLGSHGHMVSPFIAMLTTLDYSSAPSFASERLPSHGLNCHGRRHCGISITNLEEPRCGNGQSAMLHSKLYRGGPSRCFALYICRWSKRLHLPTRLL